jgi:hypothetical protein
MKPFNKKFILTATLIASTYTALLWAGTDPNGSYEFVAMKDCQVVMQKEMTPEQLEAYLALKQHEQKMQELELPIQDLEVEIQQYSEQIKSLVELAIVDNEDSLHIDKVMLQQHDIIANEFSDFMSEHQSEIEAIGEHGQVIAQYAKSFEAAIKGDLDDVNYDHIQIITPDKPTLNGCYGNSTAALM